MVSKETLCTYFNVADVFKTLSLADVQAFQKNNSLPYAIGILNLKAGLNISNIIRSAVVFGAEKVFIIGRRRFDRRGCVGATNYIDLHYIEKDVDDPEQQKQIIEEISQEYTPMFVEQGGYDINCEDFYYSPKSCFIFGEEGIGIPESMMKLDDYKIYAVPQYGVLRSLNVASTAAIVMNKVANDLRIIPKGTL
jgi:tRNA G18 (ribose-2'-O)-methylase SpoU